jgi:hypothetical protein
MPRPKKHDTDRLRKIQGEIRRSKRWRNQKDYDNLWRRMIDLYRGKHYETLSNADRALVNVAFSTKNVIAPSVAVNNPRFVVSARKPGDGPQAVIAEEVLNYLWRTFRYQADFRLAVDDFLVVGHGWVKVAYKAEKPPEVKKIPDALGDDNEGIDNRDAEFPSYSESEITSFENDRPYIERISPFDMFVDPDARHPKELGWICQRIRRRVADVRVDSRYDEKVRKEVQGSHSSRWSEDERDGRDPSLNPEQGTHALVDVYEFYDLRRKEYCIFADNCEIGFLCAPKPMPYAFGSPFLMLRNYEIPDHFYPMGELEAIEDLQHELNETRTQMVNHRKRFARKWLYLEDRFDQRGINALESDEDNTMVPVLGDESPGTAVVPMPAVGTPPDFYNQSDLIQGDVDRVTGVSDYMRGDSANIRRTATEAAMIQDAQNSRAADKLARIELALAEIGGKLIQLMQQFLSGEQTVRIVGLSQPNWVTFDADYISGEFDFEVEGGSTQPRNESFRRQSALQLVDAMAPFIGQGVVNPLAVARHVLQSFGVKDVDAFLMQEEQQMPEEGMPAEPPPEEGMPMGGGMPMEDEGSMVDGIPQELLSAVMASSGFQPSPANSY